MHACLLRCRPTRCVHARCPLTLVTFLHPIHEQSNCVLRLRQTTQICRYTFTRTASYAHRHVAFTDYGLTYVDVVRVQVIRYVRILAGPGFECLELRFRLRHVGVEVIEVSQRRPCAVSSIGVGRVKSLMVLDVHKHLVLARFDHQLLVLGQRLHGRFCDHDVDAAADGVERDWVVRRVGSEDGDGVVGGECIDGGLVSFWVPHVTIRICIEGCV